MGVSSMIATFGNMLWFYFLPTYYSTRFSATPTEISFIYAAWVALGALGSAPAGALADIFGRKKIIVISSFISTISIFVLAFSQNFSLSAIALPISGVGSSFFLVSNTLVAESVASEKRGSAFGYFSSMSGLAAAFSPLIGGLTISARGYFPLFITGGVLTLIAVLIRTAYLKETLPYAPPRTRSVKFRDYTNAARGIIQNKYLIVLVVANSVYNLFVQQSSFITPLYASKVLGYDTITSGILFSALLAAVALSKIIFGKMSDRIGRKRVVALSWIAEITVVYVFVFANSLPIAVIGIGLWMLFGAMDVPAINAWVAESTDANTRGLSMGVFYAITFLPSVPALVISGYLFSIGPRLPFYANSIVSTAALVLLAVFSRTPKQHIDQTPD
jgi:MFS transporter, DHA1 family, multidrug resistance protein